MDKNVNVNAIAAANDNFSYIRSSTNIRVAATQAKVSFII
jgi:hypothetical protein